MDLPPLSALPKEFAGFFLAKSPVSVYSSPLFFANQEVVSMHIRHHLFP